VSSFRAGDHVRILGAPPELSDGELRTKSVFAACVGKEFVVRGIEENGWVELVVAPVTGSPHETIWIEPEYLETVR
jgi:hypothetical protein